MHSERSPVCPPSLPPLLNSFQTLQRWVSELQEKGPKDMQITIAANKKDLESMRQVDQSEAEAYAESIGAGYVETSAKDDVGVHELFLSLCRKVPAPVPVADAARGGIYLSSQTQGGKGKGACC
jgi:translation elongation factor EF-4